MAKTEKIRLIYAIFLGVFCFAVGLAVICVAANIYYGGADGVIYTREIVGERLQKLAIPFIILVAAIAIGSVFPSFGGKVKPTSEDIVNKLKSRIPTGGEGEEFDSARQKYEKTSLARFFVWLAALAVTLASAIAILCYLCDGRNFSGENISAEMLRLVGFVMPCSAAALIALIIAAVVNGVVAKRQLDAVRKLIKHGNGECAGATDPAVAAFIKSVWNSNITLWAVRGFILAIAVAFIIAGVCNGGAHDVLVKAVNICQECIGLG